MVQEVQQQGNWYQTPNEIQGIWDIRRRIREHTQVTPSLTYQASFHSDLSVGSYGWEYSELKHWTFTDVSARGNTVFKLTNGDIRVPLAWAYLVTMKIWGWASWSWWMTAYHYLKVWNKTIYDASTQAVTESWATTIQFVENFGKYNLVEYRAKWYFSGSWWGGTGAHITLTLSKL